MATGGSNASLPYTLGADLEREHQTAKAGAPIANKPKSADFEGRPSEIDLRKISRETGQNWKDLLRSLKIDQKRIQTFDCNNPNNIVEACFLGLMFWENENAQLPVTWGTLIEALKEAELTKLAKKLSTNAKLPEQMANGNNPLNGTSHVTAASNGRTPTSFACNSSTIAEVTSKESTESHDGGRKVQDLNKMYCSSSANAPMDLKLKLPRDLKLENKFDNLLLSVKDELCRLSSNRLSKAKFSRLCDFISLKCRRERADGDYLPVLNTPEAAYVCIVKKSHVFEPVVVHQVVNYGMDNANLKHQLEDFEGALKSFCHTTVTSISHPTTSLRPCDDRHAHMAVLCSEEEVLLSFINKMKYYFQKELKLDDIFFEGYSTGCTVVYITISKEDIPHFRLKILSLALDLQKQFSLTHLIVFNHFVCDLEQKTIRSSTMGEQLPNPVQQPESKTQANHTLADEEFDQLDQFKVKEGSLVWMMMGVTGAGKSCLGNFILGQDDSFTESEIMMVSETETACLRSSSFDNENICVIDTPGLGDSANVGSFKSDAEDVANDYSTLATELTKVMMMMDQGINAFLIAIPANHRDCRGLKALLDFCNIIGNYWNHSILVVTHGEELGKTKVDQYVMYHKVLANPKCSAPLKKLWDKVNGRLVIVEAKDWRDQPEYHRSVVRKIMKYSKEITDQHGSFKDELQSIGREAYEKAKLELIHNCDNLQLDSPEARVSIFQSTFKYVREVVHKLVRIKMADGEDLDKLKEMVELKENNRKEVTELRERLEKEYLEEKRERSKAEEKAEQEIRLRKQAEQARDDADARRQEVERNWEIAEQQRERAEFEIGRMEAEQQKNRTEVRRVEAMQQKERAEEAEIAAKQQKERAEKDRVAAEQETKREERARLLAECQRTRAEEAKRAAEQKQKEAENERMESKQKMKKAEEDKLAAEYRAEKAEKSMRVAKQEKENTDERRAAAERETESAEVARLTAEYQTKKAEKAIRAAIQERENADRQRVAAEEEKNKAERDKIVGENQKERAEKDMRVAKQEKKNADERRAAAEQEIAEMARLTGGHRRQGLRTFLWPFLFLMIIVDFYLFLRAIYIILATITGI